MKIFILNKKKGFAMLFTVLIVSIILSIGLGISNLTFKQTILSSLAKDSQIAFYQADAGTECGMYYDVTVNLFPRGMTLSTAPSSLRCGDKTVTLDTATSQTNYFVYKESISDTTRPCVTIVFDKLNDPVKNVVQARGYNVCAVTARQVERALQVKY